MIKKRYLAVAGLMVLAVAATGCGKKSEQPSTVEVTPTPTAEATPTVTVELVDMETTEEKNVMGEKTSTASKLTLVNQTGSDVQSIYIRQHPSDDEEDTDEWGEDLVGGMFTLKNGDNAVYYYEKPSSTSTYDIRISFTDEEKNECFFRDLPLTKIVKITLRMSGADDEAIPYATYTTSAGGSEVSTLDDVKKRLGMDTEDQIPKRHQIQPARQILLIPVMIRSQRIHRITMMAIIMEMATIMTETVTIRSLLTVLFRQLNSILAGL